MRSHLLILLAVVAACARLQPPEQKPLKVDASNIVKAQEAGYQIVNRNGEKLYCRKDLTTGSRIVHTTVCLTESDWQELHTETRRTIDKVLQTPLPPKSQAGGGAGG